MRLNKNEIEYIKSVIQNFLPDSRIYIFGSILKNTRGGDIDIFVVPSKKLDLKKRIKFQAEIENILEEQFLRPVDVIISKDLSRSIEKEAIKGVLI